MNIHFGALCEPIKEQLGFDSKDVKHIQKDADAVTRLLLRGLINDSQAHQARKRIMKKVDEAIVNKMKEEA